MLVHRLIPFFVLMLDLVLLGSALAAGRASERNRRFAFLMLALAVWSLGVLGLRWAADASAAFAWQRVLHLGVVAIPALFYHYVRSLLGLATRSRPLVIAYGLGGAFAMLVPTPAFIAGVRLTGWGFVPVPGPAYVAFVVYFVATIVFGLAVLFGAYRGMTSPFRRNRIRLVMLGGAIALAGGIVDFLRFVLDAEWLYPAGMPAGAVFALALGIAIVRYRLVNLGVMAKRMLFHGVTWAVMAPVLLVVVDAAERLLPPSLASAPAGGDGLGRLIGLLAVVVLALPLVRMLEHVIGPLIFQRQRAVMRALVALNRQVAETLDVETLARVLTDGLVRGIPVAEATLYAPLSAERFAPVSRTVSPTAAPAGDADLPDGVVLWLRATRRTLVIDGIACQEIPDGPPAAMVEGLERRGTALVLPLSLGADLGGILVVGDKLSGEVFDPGEIKLLEILAGHAATALQKARFYEDLRTQMEELRTTRDLYGEAREADRAKEQFLAMLAHELRNPLGPILNATRVLGSLVGADPKATRLVAMVRRQGEQLARLVDDLLDVSRIRLGKIRLEREPVDLKTLVGECLETVRASGKGHGRELRLELAEEPLVVEGDPGRLEQVLWNLLDNALKSSPPDTPITIRALREGAVAVVEIEDRGIGIAPAVLPGIFELFAQAPGGGAGPRGGGLGLGLALVRSLVEQHGGTVQARSAGVGQGSTFVVRLPLAPAGALPRLPAPPLVRGAGRKVLVVDDDVDARDALRELLELLGHTVESVADGESAIATALRWSPEVMLVDIGLPDIDGHEVARRLRATPLGPRIRLVAVTGFAQPEDRRRALESGFDAYLVKPVAYEELGRIVAEGRPVSR
jgi:signal transduction histidine kinase/CheY-like chemotaxis protein